MVIAEEIYRRAQYLPEGAAREVLNFIGYLEQQYELPNDRARGLEQARFGHIRENPDDAVWNDLFFAQSRTQ